MEHQKRSLKICNPPHITLQQGLVSITAWIMLQHNVWCLNADEHANSHDYNFTVPPLFIIIFYFTFYFNFCVTFSL